MEAFQVLKKAMTGLLTLSMPNFSMPFEIETNALGFGIGAVLMQQGRSLVFSSQAVSERMQMKSMYEKKFMAIVFAVQKWRHYLLGGGPFCH